MQMSFCHLSGKIVQMAAISLWNETPHFYFCTVLDTHRFLHIMRVILRHCISTKSYFGEQMDRRLLLKTGPSLR